MMRAVALHASSTSLAYDNVESILLYADESRIVDGPQNPTPEARVRQVRGHCVKTLSALQFRFPHLKTTVGFQLARQQTPHPAPHFRRLRLGKACPKVVFFFPWDIPDSGLVFEGTSGATETKFGGSTGFH